MKIAAMLDTMEQLFRMERQIPEKKADIEIATDELQSPECKGYKLTIAKQRVAGAQEALRVHKSRMDELAGTIPGTSSMLLTCEFVAENRLKREDLMAAVTKATGATETVATGKTSWRERTSTAPSQKMVEAKQALEKATLALKAFEERVEPLETFVKEEQEREAEREEYDAWLTEWDKGMEGPKPGLIRRMEAKWLAECLEGCVAVPIPKGPSNKLRAQSSL